MCRPRGWWAGFETMSAVAGVAILRAQLASGNAPLRRAYLIVGGGAVYPLTIIRLKVFRRCVRRGKP
eukprot:2650062-Pleurochrysis_carterae.AAC.1